MRDVPVLVVDDNETNCRILKEMLTNWNMRPTVVDCGEAALSALQKACDAGERFTLVLLDCMMPGMDGFTLAERINGNPGFGHPTMMMLGSGNQRGETARSRELGIAVHLAKPILQADLLRAIRTALRLSMETSLPVQIVRPSPVAGKRLNILLAEGHQCD